MIKSSFDMLKIVIVPFLLLLITLPTTSTGQQQPLVPRIDGDWWQVAGNPDLGAYTTDRQQPVDFGIWQAADGTWQLWSCIRHTTCGANTRLFYGWEGKHLRDRHWTPKGIKMEADTTIGEASGGLQAPHVILHEGKYLMFYGDWNRICLAESMDGKVFTRVLNAEGEPDLFYGPYFKNRDPMVMKEDGLFYCYYMGNTDEDGMIKIHDQLVKMPHKSAIFCRTSADLKHWSNGVMVSAGGMAARKSNWWGGDAECPFVLRKDGYYYLFRNQLYLKNDNQSPLNTQYASKNPLDFGVDHDDFYIGTLEVAAPEIFKFEDQWYIAALMPGLDGIRIAKLKWVPASD